MKPTPESDAERIETTVKRRESCETVNLVSYDFACGLERRLLAYRDVVEELIQGSHGAMARLRKIHENTAPK